MPNTNSFTSRLPRLWRGGHKNLTAADVRAAREYIAGYWPKLTRFHPQDNENLIGLPKPYLVPAHEQGHEFDFNELYYWDSYFMVQGMLDEEHKELVIGILEDLVSMFKRFKIIPNASRTYLMGRSQPPLLTSFIMDVYNTYKLDKEWLTEMISVAKDEYQIVWMGKAKPNARQVYEGLSRYYDVNYIENLAETESGWDFTPRFNHHALNYLPIDLNCLLYKYERDFAAAARILGEENEANDWDRAAHERLLKINQLMWSEMRGLYYDYNYVKRSRGAVSSLAAYSAMWSGLAAEKTAVKMVNNLRKFEKKGGLSATDSPQVGQLMPGAMPMQWAYPNGWAPLHFMVVKGLQRYGYDDHARRIALKWLKTNLDWFNRHGVFLEKYNVVQPDKPPQKGVYPSQTGFGWTNAIFERFCQEFIDEHSL
ncbi:MAG TPA: trehalase family glycosidase [Candidatus Saccharimonadales bacterium]|nr:trehalase family glycosidase [Candidatus Saccharimonadales bacterium]